MKIANTAVNMDAQHASSQKQKIREFLAPIDGNGRRQSALTAAQESRVQISAAGSSLQSSEASAINDGIKAAENDPMLRLLRAMVAALTGEKAEISNISCFEAKVSGSAEIVSENVQATTGPGNLFVHHEIYSEHEEAHFSVNGIVQTSDGQRIEFNLALHMERSYVEEVLITAPQIERRTQDPLVLNFEGSAAQLIDQRFHFDLDADGVASEAINFLKRGSGFLVFDRNADGKVNDGSELFGVRSGDGFADLALLDDDKNGWIDEGDKAWSKLRLWRKEANGQDQLDTLKEANVGALYLGRVKTPFSLKNSSNELLGQIRSSGVFLSENGQVGSIQQLDLSI